MDPDNNYKEILRFDRSRGRASRARGKVSSIKEAEKEAKTQIDVKSANYGNNREFDTFDPTFEETKSSKSKILRTSDYVADYLKLNTPSIEFYCWRCDKWINQNSYK